MKNLLEVSTMIKLSNYISPIIALSIIFLVWEFLVKFFSVEMYVLPAPSDILLSLNSNLNELSYATIYTLNITLIALIIIWVGLDNAQIAILILSVIVAFFPVLANTNLGFRSVDNNLRELFIINRASKWQILTKLNLPFAIPYILTGMKTSIGLALIGTVVAEFVAGTGSSTGLSWIIIESGNRLDIAKLFAALILLVLLGVFLFLVMSAIEYSVLRRWHQSTK